MKRGAAGTLLLLVAQGGAGSSAAQGGYDAAMELLAADDYRGALLALDSEDDFSRRKDGESELYYRASDPSAALAAAEEGLAVDPDHLNLRFRATASALWLGAGMRARAHNEALRESIARGDLTPDERALWLQAAADYASEATRLVELDEARAGAIGRARTVSWVGLVALVGSLAWALLKRPGIPRE